MKPFFTFWKKNYSLHSLPLREKQAKADALCNEAMQYLNQTVRKERTAILSDWCIYCVHRGNCMESFLCGEVGTSTSRNEPRINRPIRPKPPTEPPRIRRESRASWMWEGFRLNPLFPQPQRWMFLRQSQPFVKLPLQRRMGIPPNFRNWVSWNRYSADSGNGGWQRIGNSEPKSALAARRPRRYRESR